MIGAPVLASIQRWDVRAYERLLMVRLNGALVRCARNISHSADGWGYLLIPPAACFAIGPAAIELTLVLLAAFSVERTLYFVIKTGFKRRRPERVFPDCPSLVIPSDEFSFPSGHTSAAFLVVTLLALVWSPLFALAYLWAALVGASRVVLGVHFVSDVVAGAVIGSVIGFLSQLGGAVI